MSEINWDALRYPFAADEVDFRLQSSFKGEGDKMKGIAIVYIDARAVQERLDAIAGPANWSFDWQPLSTKDGVVTVAKGTLTICGISKSDVGDAGQTEPTKATVSDALKRAAVMWGIGRYLYSFGTTYCELETKNGKPFLSAKEIDRLRQNIRPEFLPITAEQLEALEKLGTQLKLDVPAYLTKKQASELGKAWHSQVKGGQA